MRAALSVLCPTLQLPTTHNVNDTSPLHHIQLSMSEAMDCYNLIPPLPDTGGTSRSSSSLNSPCSNNIVKTDLNSRELDLKDCLLNGNIGNFNAYLPNNNVCAENVITDTDISTKEDSFESEEYASGDITHDSDGQLKDGDGDSVTQSGRDSCSYFELESIKTENSYRAKRNFIAMWFLLHRRKTIGNLISNKII